MAAPLTPDRQHAPVLVTGATSQVGVFALPRLLAKGFPVIALSRKAPPGSEGAAGKNQVHWMHREIVEAHCGDAGEELGGGLEDIGFILSCGPVELAARLVSYCPRLRRVVCFSTSSVYSKLNSPNAGERRLIAGIKASEDELRRRCEARGADLCLLRPTLIYGCGLDQNISRIARLVDRFHFIPVAGKASGRRQPVHADDLAQLAVRVLEAAAPGALDGPVAGGSVLSYREMVRRIFTAKGMTARIVSLPPRVLATLVRLIAWLPAAGGMNAEFVFRQNEDLVFDDSWLRDRLDYHPRPFKPGPEDFEVPEHAAALQPPWQPV